MASHRRARYTERRMLAPRHIFFTALDGALLDPASKSWTAAEPALDELARRRIPLVLLTPGTRAQIEPLRRKLEHQHPFITESGGGLFLADGYFSLHLEGAMRVARYFCVPFGKPHTEAAAALEEIAAGAGASVVGYSQMSPREIASNTGLPLREAELARQLEFSERFFFAGETDAAVRRFTDAARAEGWQTRADHPFSEFFCGNDEARAVGHLMRLYRQPRTRLSSVGIGSAARDLPLLSAVDHAVVLPRRGGEADPDLLSHLSKPMLGEAAGPEGWSSAVLEVLNRE
jgi:mannosyl-3-phosphoglycerate phosphatase family protein